MMDEKKISQKTLNKSFNLWFWGALTCFSQEQMQTFGYSLFAVGRAWVSVSGSIPCQKK